MKKFAADADDDENLMPGTHDDASPKARHIMRALIEVTTQAFPGTSVMVCLMEPETERMNYASNVQRRDMLAMLKAMLKRLRRKGTSDDRHREGSPHPADAA